MQWVLILTDIETRQHMQRGARPSLDRRRIRGQSRAGHPRLVALYSRSRKESGVQSPERRR